MVARVFLAVKCGFMAVKKFRVVVSMLICCYYGFWGVSKALLTVRCCYEVLF